MAETIKDLLLDSVKKHGNSTAIRYKEDGVWKTFTYSELERRTQNVGELLNQLQFQSGDRIGIQMENNPMWPEIYFGIAGSGFTAVPMDSGLGKEGLTHILGHSECRAIFATTKTERLIREVIGVSPHLKTVILVEKESIKPQNEKNATFLDYKEQVEKVAKKAASPNGFFKSVTPNVNDVASIIYTSGTTGRPKGAMLTHKNFYSNVEGCFNVVDVGESDNFILVLPLHHVFAFTANLLLPVYSGAEISIAESLRALGKNIREVSPSVLIAVPLLLEKMHKRIIKGLKQKRGAHLMFRLGIKNPIIRGIRKNLGGKLRLAISGGAPAGRETLQGFTDLGIPVAEGYGLTETAPVLSMNPPDSPRPGTVGKALPGIDIKIMKPNDQGVGEIVARGDNIMKGYLNDPDATAATMNGEFFLTGDLGFIDDDNFITITGRKKSVIVSREGKNIYPEEVESYINTSPLILESLILPFSNPGETGEKVGLIVVPDQEAVALHLKISEGGTANSDDIDSLMREVVKERTAKLAAYKRPRKIQVRTEEFERTSTRKIKRYLYKIDADGD